MEKKCTEKKERNISIETPLDKELNDALNNFHQQYGNDFQGFLLEVRESLRKQGKLKLENIEPYQF